MEIKGFENYLVYEDGRVYNKEKKNFMKLTICKNKNSKVVNLSNKGKQRTFTIKTLVGKYYIPKGGIPFKQNSNYLIYANGKVWSFSKGGYLNTTTNKEGYTVLSLVTNDKNRATFKISRLVAEHFLTNPNNLPEVDHKDRNRQNNCIDNLRYTTSQDNARNKGKQKNNTSGYTGIYQNEWGNWKACFNISKSKTKSKTFKTIEEAITFRKEMVDKYYNRPNFNII